MASNINTRAILQSSRVGIPGQFDFDHVYTMSFMASPWEFPDTFNRIPRLILRALVDPTSWEVVTVEARLSYGYRYKDILLPSRYIPLEIF